MRVSVYDEFGQRIDSRQPLDKFMRYLGRERETQGARDTLEKYGECWIGSSREADNYRLVVDVRQH